MLPSDNPGYGFFGEVTREKGQSAAKAEWAAAFQGIEDSLPRGYGSEEGIRNYLDSKYGRWLAGMSVLRGFSVFQWIKENKRSFMKEFQVIQKMTDNGNYYN